MLRTSARTLGIAVLALAAIAGTGLAGFMTTTRSASALTNCTVADNTFDSQEQAFLGLINTYRAQNGRPALAVSTNLNRSASWLAQDLATKNYFSHTDSLGRDPSTRAQQCGYPSGAGENIAAGTFEDTAQEAFDAWKASSGHNANMLNSTYKQIGIARYYNANSTYKWYWATDFGLVDDGTSGGATGGGTTGGGTVTATKAVVGSPAAGSTLAGSTAAFSWNATSGALEYFFYAGSSAGANNYYGQSTGLNPSVTVGGLPTNGSTVYVRLWTRFATGWQYSDSTYRAATTTTTITSSKAAITSPAPGSLLTAGSQAFSWSAASGAQEYFFYLGTGQGLNNIYGQSQALRQSVTVNVPAHSTALWVRLWTRSASGWQYTDYQYR
jgi:uncharacterized protein YkwD